MDTLALILGYSLMIAAGICAATLCTALAVEFVIRRFCDYMSVDYKLVIRTILNARPKK